MNIINKILLIVCTFSLILLGCSAPLFDDGIKVGVKSVKNLEYRYLMNTYKITEVQIELINYASASQSIILDKNGVVYNNGESIGILIDSLMSHIPDECYGKISNQISLFGQPIVLLPNSRVQKTLCFQQIDFSKEPKLFISLLTNLKQINNGYTEVYEGTSKEFSISLSED